MKITRIYWALIIIVVGVGVFCTGYGFGSDFPIMKNAGGTASYEQGFKDGMNNAKKIVNASGVLPPEPSSVMSVTGTIQSIDGDSITISAAPITANPLADQGPRSRVIKVFATTPIVALVNKTADELQADLKKFQADTKAGKNPVPPSPDREAAAALSDLKLTMVITADASSDVRDAQTIDATKISFQTY